MSGFKKNPKNSDQKDASANQSKQAVSNECKPTEADIFSSVMPDLDKDTTTDQLSVKEEQLSTVLELLLKKEKEM
jgi:hypothetical protein